MIWVLIIGVFLILVGGLGNLRVWRTEKIRMRCVDQAIESRTFHGRVYSHAEKTEVVLDRAREYERFVRGIENKKPEDPPIPPPYHP